MSSRAEQPRIHLSSPHMRDLEERFVAHAFASNWIAPLGPHVDAFEREFCERAGAGHAATLAGGGAELGGGRGDGDSGHHHWCGRYGGGRSGGDPRCAGRADGGGGAGEGEVAKSPLIPGPGESFMYASEVGLGKSRSV
jgi:hypothetical protein